MLTILITGMILTALALGILWGGFKLLQKQPRFKQSLNSRNANKRMLQLTLLIYFVGITATIAMMAM
ncbi:hypothetical protein QCB45_07955 [Thiomicrorhabdus sp. ZW0627]|uniref:hypothetical protein n=1 Tax=Thiomicrorhabdus sp. ZW0627 TaxID=3039774 RepID=UPI00243639F9|nr:hypothetical protein [Thiomicrorhabdus sp. ZW0627]MDG6774264.1 hypothetical protein [Thiomicrorhabdus sp. ZW0627]